MSQQQNIQQMVQYSLDDLMMRVKNFNQLKKLCSRFFVLPKSGYRKRYLKRDLELNRIPRINDLPPIIEERYPNILALKKDMLVQKINQSNFIFNGCQNKIHVVEEYDSSYLRRVLVRVLPQNDQLLEEQIRRTSTVNIPQDFAQYLSEFRPIQANRRRNFLGLMNEEQNPIINNNQVQQYNNQNYEDSDENEYYGDEETQDDIDNNNLQLQEAAQEQNQASQQQNNIMNIEDIYQSDEEQQQD